MFNPTFHLLIFLWTFLSISINTVTSNCFYQLDESRWTCENMTISSKNIDTDLQNINKTDIDVLGFSNLNGDFDSSYLQNFTDLRKIFIADSKFDKFQFEFHNLKNFLFVRNEVPEGTTFANCCVNMEKLIIKSNKGLDVENEGFVGLKRIKELDIKYQNIKQLTRATFKGLYKLRQLSLINNSMESIQEDAFNDLVHLKELYIEDYALKSIDQRAFEPLTQLRSLTIYGENLPPLPLEMFKNQRKLKEIGLPVKTWQDVDVEKIPQSLPELSFFSHKKGSVTSEEAEYIRRKHKKLVRVLFRQKDT